MAYMKAVFLAIIAAIALGMATGAFVSGWDSFGKLPASDKAVVLSIGLSEAMNCAAILMVGFIPAAIAVVFAKRRRRKRPVSRVVR